MSKIIVARNKAFVEYAIEIGIASPADLVFDRVNDEIVSGNDIVGAIPMRLAAVASSVTEIPLFLPKGVRIDDLDIDGIRKYAKEPRKYIVKEI